ncbi:MAG: hypothetical protein O6934_00360 [SAR324 cluster bacterium]|nr:hypothetical protein [SAR324 cluster bacterium]
MHPYLLSLHVTAMALVIGALFLQSLVVVMALRLKNPQHAEGVRIIQRRVHLFIYYPILAVALLSGLWLALESGAFAEGRWLHWKLVLVLLLIGLGMFTGHHLRTGRVVKPLAMAVHIVIFVLSLCIVYLATVKPF